MKKLTTFIFNDETSSDNKGFSASIGYCQNYINSNNGSSYFEDYKGGTVSIICNETGETVFETRVL